ncbi:MAG: hypothetical protein ABJQ04_00550 [Roseibium sp.]
MELQAKALSHRATAISDRLNSQDKARIVGPASVRRLPPFVQMTTSGKSQQSVEHGGRYLPEPLLPDLAQGGLPAIFHPRAAKSPTCSARLSAETDKFARNPI